MADPARVTRANWRPRCRLANRCKASPLALGQQAQSAACLSFLGNADARPTNDTVKRAPPRSGNVDDQSWMLSFVCTRIEEQDDLLLPAWATSSFTTVAGQAVWRGVKPTLDALIDVAAVGCAIKTWRQPDEDRPPRCSYRAGSRDRTAVSAGQFLGARAQRAANPAVKAIPTTRANNSL